MVHRRQGRPSSPRPSRKRFLLVGTLGHVLSVLVTPANVQKRQGAQQFLDLALGHLSWLNKLLVDGGYSGGDFAAFIKGLRPKLEVKRSPDTSFKVLPKRRVVERTFAWLVQCRRLTRNYERTTRVQPLGFTSP